MNKNTLRANAMLLTAAALWGATFVAQRASTEYLSPFAFQAIRCLLSAALLLPLVPMLDRGGQSGGWRNRELWLGGAVCGLAVFLATNLQQYGMAWGTTAGKSGFISALYIVLIPLFGILRGNHPGRFVWFSVPLAVCGLYLLCVNESFTLAPGDVLTLIAAVFCAMHILSMGRFSPHLDAARLCCVQFLVSGVLSAIAMAFTGLPTLRAVADCWLPLGYAVIFSSVIAYVFQAIGQRSTSPTVASLLMSLEAVFACLSGWALLHEKLSLREGIGCVIMFCAVILAQLPDKKTEKSQK